jgi:hypothetical protein
MPARWRAGADGLAVACCRHRRELAWRVTPAGLLEWCGPKHRHAADLAVRFDAANPALLAARCWPARRPAVDIDGDAQLAGDVNWLMQNLRWDPWRPTSSVSSRRRSRRQLHRLGRAGRRPARGGAGPRFGRCANAGRPARAQTLSLACGTCAPDLHRLHRPALRPRRGGAVGLPTALGARRWCACSPSGAAWTPRGVACAMALERLGPIFVKFGQVLSTRRDLLPLDVADELARLQDRVPPFPAAQARALVEKAYGRSLEDVFATFDAEPVASASIAQVHFATLKGGREVAVKVLRPGMLDVIEDDLTPAAHAGALGRAPVGRRQAAQAARGGGRVRRLPARRARPGARGRQRRAAAPQHERPEPGAGARDGVGPVHAHRDGHGAHERRADQPDRACATPVSTSPSWRATA